MSNLPIQNNTPLLNSLLEKANSLPDANERFEAGKKAEYDAFWDVYQDNGKRTAYNYAFAGNGWNENTFKPKYDMDVTEASTMFAHSHIKDFKALCEAAGVSVTFARCTNFGAFMSWNSVEVLPVIDTRSCTALGGIFNGATNLRQVDKLIIKDDGTTTFSGSFGYCWNLRDIVFEGVIGNSLSFSDASNLTHDSLMSIINALKNYSARSYKIEMQCTDDGFEYGFDSGPGYFWHDNGVYFKVGDTIGFSGDNANGRYTVTSVQWNGGNQEEYDVFFDGEYTPVSGDVVTIYESEGSASTHTVTLGATNLAKLTDAEKAIATQKGWTLA